MSGNATDERLFFASKIGATYLLGVDQTARQTSDALGALPAGKYLIQATAISAACWIKATKWVAGQAASVVAPATPAAGVSAVAQEFPLTTGGIKSFTLNVRRGVNDRIEAVCGAGATATLAITRMGE